MKRTCLILTLFICFYKINAQTGKIQALSIGQKCPDTQFSNIINYDKTSAKISEFKGKFILLDFFGVSCVPCVKSLPKMDSLQRKFKNDLQIIIVCTEDKEKIGNFFKRLSQKGDFSVPFFTEDTTFYQYFKHAFVPFYVIIDKNGIVRAIPPENEVNEENIKSLIKGDVPNFSLVKYEEVARTDSHKAILIEPKANDAGLVIYHSLLTNYLAMLPSAFFQQEYKDTTICARITVMNNTIAFLYQMAYGNFHQDDPSSFVTWNRVIIESKDSLILQLTHSVNFNTWKLTNNYCYDLILPSSFKGDAHKVMKEDLDRVYNYDVKMEKRKARCIVFRKGPDGDKIVNSEGKAAMEMNTYHLRMQNASWKEMLYWLENKYLYELPIIDETGYDHVSLEINADLTDANSLSKALKPIGIDLVVEDRDVDMLVIRDKFTNGTKNN